MTPLKLSKGGRDDGAPKGQRKGRHTAVERRSGKDRRRKTSPRRQARSIKVRRDDDRRSIRDLYKTDLDRHLWSWPVPSARKKRQKERERRRRRRKVAGIVASAAGAVGAAGLSYLLYRRLRDEEERPPDPMSAQGDLDDADFD